MNKKGKLIVVASTGGLKLENDSTWYNPHPEAKATIESILLRQCDNSLLVMEDIGEFNYKN